MERECVSLKLSNRMRRSAPLVADAENVTIGHLVRQLLQKEIDRRTSAQVPYGADERLVTALRALLACDLAEAEGWGDLDRRLTRHGYELRPSGGALYLFKRSCGTRLCEVSELGISYRHLVKRFRCGMPGHPLGTSGLASMPEEEFDPIGSF